jgi:hypothetical protein
MRSIFGFALILLLLAAGCSSKKADDEGKQEAAVSCTEPENPYTAGSGHHAGYEWAENRGGGDCNGRSQSFNEGCEEYEEQEADFQDCEEKKK